MFGVVVVLCRVYCMVLSFRRLGSLQVTAEGGDNARRTLQKGILLFSQTFNFLPQKYYTPFSAPQTPKILASLLDRRLTLSSTKFDNSSEIVVFPCEMQSAKRPSA